MIRRPPRSTQGVSSAASDVYKRQTPSFAKILHTLYDMDVISEESVLAWAEEKADADESEKKFLNLARPFVDWLEEASSEEESSSEEE